MYNMRRVWCITNSNAQLTASTPMSGDRWFSLIASIGTRSPLPMIPDRSTSSATTGSSLP
jgi:hypothetical protein